MTETPKWQHKGKTYSLDLYDGGGTGGFIQEIPIEWDILAAASDRCLLGRCRGWIEREIVRETPASVMWRLWSYELGEFGTFEVRKIGAGRSQITFSGLGFLRDENGNPFNNDDKRRDLKKEHMIRIIEAYFNLLSQENIFPLDELTTTENWHPWELIPDINSDRKIIELWCKYKTAKEITKEVGFSADTIHNKISTLRRDNKDAKIPFDRERKSMKF